MRKAYNFGVFVEDAEELKELNENVIEELGGWRSIIRSRSLSSSEKNELAREMGHHFRTKGTSDLFVKIVYTSIQDIIKKKSFEEKVISKINSELRSKLGGKEIKNEDEFEDILEDIQSFNHPETFLSIEDKIKLRKQLAATSLIFYSHIIFYS